MEDCFLGVWLRQGRDDLLRIWHECNGIYDKEEELAVNSLNFCKSTRLVCRGKEILAYLFTESEVDLFLTEFMK